MSQQYLRNVSVRCTDKNGLQKAFNGLRVTFEITKSEDSSANKANIKVYNLNKNSRSFVEDQQLTVELLVGYKGTRGTETLAQLFIGNMGEKGIGRTYSERMGQEWVTTFEVGDGEKQLNESHVELSFDKGVPFPAIISQVVQSFGLPLGSVQPVGEGIAANGFTASGRAKDVMDKLASRFGFNWSIQNNSVQITREGVPTPETAVVLSPQTGLIGNVTKREKGIELRALLNPQIVPGRILSVINSAQVTAGFFKTTSAKYVGDNYGEDWTVSVEAIPALG